ncbi:SRPBCC family protein [Nocardioides sp. 1609]|uniref:SRPBCC family protein n=1 Tax=Nocardioides sp. 1609 TaxID=2508327 RepID=UPI00106F20F3|nr:SRPBCC family protein [Nocardioides sp. 1609]
MDLTHRFTVPIGVEETWAAFQDIAALAECFPGAQVTSADGDTFAGSVKVKLGPIALVYNGSGTFVEKDDAAHRFLVDAKGKDKRGNGTAGAKVTLSMVGSAGASGPSTDVEVVTDLAITGKPAQFGRGVMQDVSDKLLGQFVACLEQRLTAQPEPAAAPDLPPEPEPAPEPASEPASELGAAPATFAPDLEPTPIADAAAAAPQPAAAPAPTPRAVPPPRAVPNRAPDDDALDLGAAVLPVLAKSYWKQGLAGLVAVLVVWRLLRR